MTADEVLDALIATLEQLRQMLPGDKAVWDDEVLVRLAVERLWITAGNLAERTGSSGASPPVLNRGQNWSASVISGAHRVIEFDNAGAFVRNYMADAASSPRPLVGVAVDGAGNVYGASGGPIIKWGPDGRVAAHLEPPAGYRAWKPSLAANSGGDLWIAEPGRRNSDGNLIAIVHRMSVSG